MVTTPNEFTLELYRQAWQQARHNELLRAGYVALYTLVIATVVGLLGQDKFRYPVGPYCFLGFLSMLGVLLSWRFAANANRWTRLQKRFNRPMRRIYRQASTPTTWRRPKQVGRGFQTASASRS